MAASGHLVGRAAELGSIDHLLDEIGRGRSAVLLLLGEPGIGKTRLLAELAERADSRGCLALTGSASELESDLPFWVFVDALDEYAEGLDPARLKPLDGQTRAELAHVFPSMSLVDDGDGTSLQDERYRTHRAVRGLLELLAATKPFVLILDDLHWADSGSIELVGALLRRPPSGAVLIAMAVRPRQTPERLAAAFERAHRAGRIVRLEPAALTLEEARELLGQRLGVDALYEESGGNPFYLQQLARARGASPAAATESVERAGVPHAVAAALAEELGLLPDDVRRILEGAAVAGDPFDPELMAAAAGVDEAAAVDALDELLRRDLIRPTEVPRRFRFRHPLVRRAVYEASPGGWRLGAHRRGAEALASRGAPAAALAHHLERSATRGDAKAVATLRAAGDEAAQRTPAGAARWLASALRLLPDSAPAAERVELLSALAGAQAATGHFAGARSALLECIALVQDDPAAHVRLTAACAGVEQLLGRHAEAHARLVSSLGALDDPASAQAAALMITLALDAFYRQEHDDSRAWGERALAVASPLDDRPLIAAALAAVGLACAYTEAIGDAERYCSRAGELIDAMPDAELARRLDAIAYLSGAEAYGVDRFDESIAHGRRGLAVARATGQGELVPMLTQALATALSARGLLAEAAELLDGAVESARLSRNRQSLAWGLLNRSFVAALQGEIETAVATAEESAELTRELDEGFLSMYAGVMLAIARMESGNAAEAAELFMAAAGGEALPLIPGGWRAQHLELLTRCWLVLGRLDEAERTAGFAAAVATRTGLRTSIAWAERAAAGVALARGDAKTAREHALASAAAAEATGAVVDAAVSRVVAARALVEAGDRDGAVVELELAAAALDTCGASRYRLEAERELRRLGRAVHRRTRAGKADGSGVETLTERELELARLVVDRRTNPEIAAALFLSPKTVETHLRNMFRKLGVASRVELARAVEDADRAADADAETR